MTETQDIPPERSDDIRHYDENADADLDNEPAHHARRPMNAFLIFCKRHRTVVRDRYPTLENRSITKILGEWWANIDEDDKACYTRLAKQYKDAFFTANPDFKWYKLPAPPRRTFATRPGNNLNTYAEQENYPTIESSEIRAKSTNNNHLLKINYNAASTSKHRSMFTPGKLADETQMGGLNSLLISKDSTEMDDVEYIKSHTYDDYSTPNSKISTECNVNQNPTKKHASKRSDDLARRSLNKRSDDSPIGEEEKDIQMQRLQDELSKTTRILELMDNSSESMNDSDKNYNSSYSDGACDDSPNSKNDNKHFYNEHNSNETYRLSNQTDADNSNISLNKLSHYDSEEYDDKHSNKNAWLNSIEKSHRSCKGKRYQEFMADGSLTGNKRFKKEHDKIFNMQDNRHFNHLNTPAYSWKTFDESPIKTEPASNYDKDSQIYLDVSKSAYKNTYNVNDVGQRTMCYDENSTEHNKEFEGNKFKASDFNLDAKIKALPSLSLEKFQQKKKENKKRKKNISTNKIKENKPKPSTDAPPPSVSNHKSSVDHSDDKPRPSLDAMPKPTCDRVDRPTAPINDRPQTAEQRKSEIIGSRKRKPRKISITRLDVNSTMKIQSVTGDAKMVNHSMNSNEIFHQSTSRSFIPNQNSHALEDFGLATLAEIAAKIQT